MTKKAGSEKNETNVVVVVLDKSSSMTTKQQQTVDGFNEFKNGLPKGTKMTLTLFDTDFYVAHEYDNVEDVPDLVLGKTYVPSGSTALHDAFMDSAVRLENRIAGGEDPDHVTFVVMTDGEENSSTQYRLEHVKALIAKHDHEWDFIFMGVGIDAYHDAAQWGVGAHSTVSTSGSHVAAAYAVTGRAVADSWRTRGKGMSSGAMGQTVYSAADKAAMGDVTGAVDPAAQGASPQAPQPTPPRRSPKAGKDRYGVPKK